MLFRSEGFRPQNLDWGPDLVIIGNVIKRTNPEAQEAIQRGGTGGVTLQLPDVIAKIEAVGNEVIGTSTEDAVRLLKVDADKWAKLVKERNIRFGN